VAHALNFQTAGTAGMYLVDNRCDDLGVGAAHDVGRGAANYLAPRVYVLPDLAKLQFLKWLVERGGRIGRRRYCARLFRPRWLSQDLARGHAFDQVEFGQDSSQCVYQGGRFAHCGETPPFEFQHGLVPGPSSGTGGYEAAHGVITGGKERENPLLKPTRAAFEPSPWLSPKLGLSRPWWRSRICRSGGALKIPKALRVFALGCTMLSQFSQPTKKKNMTGTLPAAGFA